MNVCVCVCVYGIFGVNSKFILFQRDSSNSRHLCESLMVGVDGCFWQLQCGSLACFICYFSDFMLKSVSICLLYTLYLIRVNKISRHVCVSLSKIGVVDYASYQPAKISVQPTFFFWELTTHHKYTIFQPIQHKAAYFEAFYSGPAGIILLCSGVQRFQLSQTILSHTQIVNVCQLTQDNCQQSIEKAIVLTLNKQNKIDCLEMLENAKRH